MTSVTLRRGALGAAIALAIGLFAAPASAFAAGRHGLPAPNALTSSHLIDTDIVVGFPQHQAAPSPGIANALGRPPVGGSGQRPTVTTQPKSETVTSGTTATFSAAASGNPSPTVQWQVATNGVSFANIVGATSTTYSFTASSTQNGDEFRAVFNNSFGSATTSAATLTVTGGVTGTAPQVTLNPVSQSVTSGTTVTFTAAASGSPTPTVQWYVNSGSGFVEINGATSTSYSFNATTTENGYQYEAIFTNSVTSATTTAATLTVTAPAPTPEKSSNWSGYADTGGPFSAVSGTWTVPQLTCSGTATAYSAQWIGIDGYSSSTVEQDGTEADCLSGSPSYDAWYEMYGDSSVNSGYEVELSPSSYPVSPGNSITASVSVSGTTWTLKIANTSVGWSYSTNVTFSGASKSSAEWIVERPEVCSRSCSLTNLANFGSVTFTGAAASITSSGTISSYPDASMEMVNGSTVLALPSTLDPAGDSFSDTWKAA